MKSALSAAALVISLVLSGHQSAHAYDNVETSKRQIEQIVESFRLAIINKDPSSFMNLFLREDISWTTVYTDGSVERYNAGLTDAKNPPAQKVQAGHARKFIESVSRNKDARSETISNVRIDTDGEIAHVWFDYVFMVGDHKNNWGKESWQLVRTESGWKIASVVWSAEENPARR